MLFFTCSSIFFLRNYSFQRLIHGKLALICCADNAVRNLRIILGSGVESLIPMNWTCIIGISRHYVIMHNDTLPRLPT